jgi:hypothetical protein
MALYLSPVSVEDTTPQSVDLTEFLLDPTGNATTIVGTPTITPSPDDLMINLIQVIDGARINFVTSGGTGGPNQTFNEYVLTFGVDTAAGGQFFRTVPLLVGNANAVPFQAVS